MDAYQKSNDKKFGSIVGEWNHLDTYKQTQTNYPRMVLTNFVLDNERFHPTQKPVALLEYLIKTYTNEGMLVLDNCMGSGTCGVACKKLNRNFIGIEKEKEYFDIAKKRIENTVVQLDLFGDKK